MSNVEDEIKRETARRIAVMAAFLDGAQIECRKNGFDGWSHCTWPSWFWDTYDYRVAAEQEPIHPSAAMAKAYCAHPGKLHALKLFAEATNNAIDGDTANLMWDAINEYARLKKDDN